MFSKTSLPWKIALVAVCVASGAIIAGRIWQNRQLSAQEDRLRVIIANLADHNPDFRGLSPSRSSHPKVWIFGELKSQEEIDQLRDAVAAQSGDVEASRIVRVRLPLPASPQPTTK